MNSYNFATAMKNNKHWLVLLFASLLSVMFASSVVADTGPLGNSLSDNINADSETAEFAKFTTPKFTIAQPAMPQQKSYIEVEPRNQLLVTREVGLRRKLVAVEAADQIWFVCARQSHLCPGDLSHVQYSVLEDTQWRSSSAGELTSAHANNKDYVTVVYAHGNRTDKSWAMSRGLQVYQQVFGQHCNTGCRPPIRFVIFAWKSEQEKFRIRPDYEIKSRRSPIVGQTFGSFLQQFSDRNMVLTGFSLGAQVVVAGLTKNAAMRDQQSYEDSSRYKVALMAPAMEPNFVGCHLRGLTANPLCERTEVFYSKGDRAIRAAEKIARKSCRAWIPVFQQLASSCNSINPVHVFDVTNEVKKQHSTETYFGSLNVQQAILRMVGEVKAADSFSPSFDLPTVMSSKTAPYEFSPQESVEVPQLLTPTLAPRSFELLEPN